MFGKNLMILGLALSLYGINARAMSTSIVYFFEDASETFDAKVSLEERMEKEHERVVDQIDIDRITQLLSKYPKTADPLKVWLKIKGRPNLGNVFTTQPLALAIRLANLPGIQVLLADPRTKIDDEIENSHNLINAITNGTSLTNAAEDKKIVKLLLFFGFNPTVKEPRAMTAQEVAHTFDDFDKDYSKWLDDYKHIAEYCTKEELAEFRETKMLREFRNHKYLMGRQIHGPAFQVKAKKKQNPAQAKALSE